MCGGVTKGNADNDLRSGDDEERPWVRFVAGCVRGTRRRVDDLRAVFERTETVVSFDQRVRRIQNENGGFVERDGVRLVREISRGEKRVRVRPRESHRRSPTTTNNRSINGY